MIDILNFEIPRSRRDLHITIPAFIYLEKYNNVSFKTVSIYEAYIYMLVFKPKMIVLSNAVGAAIKFEISKFAYLSGIKVVTFTSEGNAFYNNDVTFWGHNKDKIFYADKVLVWSKKYLEHYRPFVFSGYDEKVAVAGATGFDRYKLLKFKKKNEFLKENSLNSLSDCIKTIPGLFRH